MGFTALSKKLKRQERDADYSFPFSSEVKNGWSYTSHLVYAFTACKGQFYFILRQDKRHQHRG